MDVKLLTDRELLEGIYTMLQYVLVKVNEIDNDDKQFVEDAYVDFSD